MFVALAIVGVMSASAFAQGAGPGGAAGGRTGQKGHAGPGGQRRGGMMKLDEEVLAKLNLTDGQKDKVKALKESTTKKVQELMKASGFGKPGAGGAPGQGKPGGPGGMREKMKPIMDGYTNGMKAILTPTQYAGYEKGVKEARAKMRAQFGGGKPGGPGAGKKKGTPPPTA
jgi:Spy/CpxP family protein refolding chaperone